MAAPDTKFHQLNGVSKQQTSGPDCRSFDWEGKRPATRKRIREYRKQRGRETPLKSNNPGYIVCEDNIMTSEKVENLRPALVLRRLIRLSLQFVLDTVVAARVFPSYLLLFMESGCPADPTNTPRAHLKLFFAIFRPKSHVKPQIHLTHCSPITSAWRVPGALDGIIKLVIRKEPRQMPGFLIEKRKNGAKSFDWTNLAVTPLFGQICRDISIANY